jgi:outer membrane protein TolC
MKPMIALVLLAFLPISVSGEGAAGFAECLALMLERDPAMAEARCLSSEASIDGGLFDSAHGTRITAVSLPSFSWEWLPSPLDSNTVVGTRVLGVGLEASRKLETDGTVSLSAGNSTYLARSFGIPSVIQAPHVSLSWSQPLFENGTPFGTTAFRADRSRSRDRPIERARLALLETENGLVLDFARNYFDLRSAVAALALKRERIALDEDFGLVLAVRLSQGTITLGEAMEADLRLASERLDLVDLEGKAACLAALLSEATGLPESDFASPELPPEAGGTVPFGSGKDAAENGSVPAEISRRSLALEDSRDAILLLGRDSAPTLAVELGVSPTYPADALPPKDLGSSISALAARRARLNPSISLSLSVPVTDSGRAVLERERAKAEVERSVNALALARKRVAAADRNLEARLRTLETKEGLVRADIGNARRQRDEAERLLAIGRATRGDLDAAEHNLRVKLADLERIGVDRFLLVLERRSASGLPAFPDIPPCQR